MSGNSSNLTEPDTEVAGPGPRVNWVLALLNVPGAAIAMLFALGAVMSTDSCTDRRCPNLGGGISFDVLFYGPPVVAVLVIVASVFTAKRRAGVAVPLFGLALLVLDVAFLAASVAQY